MGKQGKSERLFIFGGTKITAGGDHSHEIKRCLLLWRKVMTNLDSIIPGEGHHNPLQYSCLENPMERGVWWVRVHGVAKSQTWLKQLSMHALRQHIKKQRHYFVNKGPSSQSYGFSSSHVWMWELDYKENWASKNWCFWTVVLEKTLESPLGCNEIQPILKEITPEY